MGLRFHRLDRHVWSSSVYPWFTGAKTRPEPPTAPSMRKKISTTIYVTPEQADKLKLLHDRTKVPVAVYIREGIDLVLRHYSHLLPGQLPLVDSTADVSRAANSKAEGKEGKSESKAERASSASFERDAHDGEEKAVAVAAKQR
jgi:hypothetical protein